MKKSLFICLLLAFACMIGFESCTGCKDKAVPNKAVGTKFMADYDGVLQDFSEGADHIIALHRQTMYELADNKKYAWYETRFTFADSLKYENLSDAMLADITDIFQTFGPDLCYMITTNVANGTLIPAPAPGLWIEDFDLSNCEIKLTINEVLQRLVEVNMPLPPAISITLRKPVGPIPCNAQYVAGNPFETVWVDAVTGEVTNWCPAFPKNIGKPLGEWP